jgi:hypothetical protein
MMVITFAPIAVCGCDVVHIGAEAPAQTAAGARVVVDDATACRRAKMKAHTAFTFSSQSRLRVWFVFQCEPDVALNGGPDGWPCLPVGYRKVLLQLRQQITRDLFHRRLLRFGERQLRLGERVEHRKYVFVQTLARGTALSRAALSRTERQTSRYALHSWRV